MELTESEQAGSGTDGFGATGNQDFEKLFATHPTPMWVYDPATLRFLTVNKAAMRLYGFSRSDYDRMTVLDIRPESERERMLASIRSLSDLGRSERWQHLNAAGEIIEVITYGRKVRFQGLDAILAIVIDRTEVTRAYKQASDTRSLLDSIMSSLPVGVFVKDMDEGGRYVLYNTACAEIIGIEPSSVIGRKDLQVFAEEQATLFGQQDRRVMDSAGVLVFEEHVARPDAPPRTIRMMKRAVPTIDGSPSRYLVGISQDVTEQRTYEDRISHIALHDALTGLPNRSFFTNHITALMAREDAAATFALMYVDIDHFKHVNDSMGHPAGDALLIEVASRLRMIARPMDMVARLGGDEFAVIFMLGEGGDGPTTLAHRLMSCFDEPVDLDGIQEHVDCSVGIALAPADGADVSTLLRNADLALYAAKAAGRSTFRFYEGGMRLNAERRHGLTSELRRALAEEEFELHFQPLLSLADDRVTAAEALVRWRHPERGLLGPGEFIAVAEETGLIEHLGGWVLRQACRAAAGWPGDVKVAVNLSPCQFKHVGLLESVIAALNEAELHPSRLQLEITETVLLATNGQNLQLLHALRDLGVGIAMDDFGTGYSSLSYLRSFPFDKIKLDRSFIAGIGHDPGSLAIVKAVTGIGAGFNLITTAEGVETEDQLTRLRQEGFAEIQGYLFARPMPEADILAFLRKHEASRAPLAAAY